MSEAYSFVSHWRVPAPPGDAWGELERMLRPGVGRTWWPAVTVPMAPRHLVAGERLVLQVRSPFGYVLRMRLRLTEVEPGRTLAASSDGDLRGSGRVTVSPGAADDSAGAGSLITFHWDVETRRAWMNATAWLLRPLFERAHAHVMRQGEQGLRADLGTA